MEVRGINSFETVAAGASGSAVPLSLNVLTSFVTTATSSSHVSLADGVVGQLKIVFHKTLGNTVSLVVTPANLAIGSSLTSDAAGTGMLMVFDGTNWQVIGEISGDQAWT